jgi:hypothetical protein
MQKHDAFSIGFFRTAKHEHMFLSVTPGFECGPGILRDGITKPRMTDPHHVSYIRHAFQLPHEEGTEVHQTENPHLQRAGTWTLYNHVKEFVAACGDQWQVVGVQSCGDLTMNPWHVAYVAESHIPHIRGKLCSLRTAEDHDQQVEPIESRVYQSLIRWKPSAADAIGLDYPYEFLDIRIQKTPEGYSIILANADKRREYHDLLRAVDGYDKNTQDLSKVVEFTLSGKPVAQSGFELTMANLIDTFQDVRHVFNLPSVPCMGMFRGQPVTQINFGEFQLFCNLNERRAALQSPVLIDLRLGDHVESQWRKVREVLLSRHFREVEECPTVRGQFRRYPNSDRVEIFLPHNVYPFGVLGLSESGLVCLASGGLSGRVGNTLEGITRIMYDFFGCTDAMVLDEGYDTFHVINPHSDGGAYKYSNEEICEAVLRFTHQMLLDEYKESEEHDNLNMKDWVLNRGLLRAVEEDFCQLAPASDTPADLLTVRPHRSQMRSVIIFAAPKSGSSGD